MKTEEVEEKSDTTSPSDEPVHLEGIPGSPGLAIGPAVVVDVRRVGVPRHHVKKHAVDRELQRYDQAVEVAARGLREVSERIKGTAARAEASILEAYILMVEDEALRGDVERHIRLDLQCAEWALDGAVESMAQQLRDGGDPYLAERSHDFEFVGDRILGSFLGRPKALSLPALEEPSIIVAKDLSPAETAGLSRDFVLALVTEMGTRTAHTAILARALEIPAVVGVRGILSRLGSGDRLVVDGFRGRVVLNPTQKIIEKTTERAEKHLAIVRGLHELKDRPAATKCGEPIILRGNIELPAEAAIAIGEGSAGIGLYRTEFLYVDRADLPSEEEQYATYRKVLEVAGDRPVVLRTFDIGGDKFASSFQVPPDMNPALGLRAVRLGLAHPEIFSEQLRAMVRASAHGHLRIMVPMIAQLREFRAVKELLARATRDVDAAGHARAAEVPLGVMVEVPSAAMIADELAREAAFLSIGTNDLIQYSLAVDRTSRELAYLASPFDPAILRLIRGVIKAGKDRGRPVSVCGAMASDPLAAVLLVGMGLRELSMEASAIGEVKEAIARVTLAEAEGAALEVLELADGAEIEQAVTAQFAPRLSDLLDAGSDDS